jgi:hypothetical protein
MSFRLGAAALAACITVALSSLTAQIRRGLKTFNGLTIISIQNEISIRSRSYCCGEADVVKTKFKVESNGGLHPDDTWYAWLNEAWVQIPSEKIVKESSPTGEALLFMLANTIQCFVPPKGGH